MMKDKLAEAKERITLLVSRQSTGELVDMWHENKKEIHQLVTSTSDEHMQHKHSTLDFAVLLIKESYIEKEIANRGWQVTIYIGDKFDD